MSFGSPLISHNREDSFCIEGEKLKEFILLNTTKAFSSFSVIDIQKAKEFYGKTLGLELSNGPEGTLVVPLSGARKL